MRGRNLGTYIRGLANQIRGRAGNQAARRAGGRSAASSSSSA